MPSQANHPHLNVSFTSIAAMLLPIEVFTEKEKKA